MLPFLDLKFIKIPMYGLCIFVGIALAAIVAYFLIKKQKKVWWDFIILSAVAFGFGMLFAKILYIIVTFPLKNFFKIVWLIISGQANELVSGGFVFYGGLIGGIVGLIVGAKIAKCKLSDYIDYYGLLVPLVHCFGRIGCFCGGCCYGMPYEGIFKVVYTNPITNVPAGVGIFPVQLLEALLLLILFFVLFILFKKGVKNIVCIYLISYGFIRIFTEFFRYDYERGFIFGLSVSQFISIIIITSTVLFLIVKAIIQKKKKIA